MDNNEIIIQVANDILNSLNIGQIVNVLRDHSLAKAKEYYAGLSEADKQALVERLKEAKEKASQDQAAAEAKANQEEEAAQAEAAYQEEVQAEKTAEAEAAQAEEVEATA